MNHLISFFDRSKGKWIAQRTTYELSNKYMKSVQSHLIVQSDQSSPKSATIASLNWKEVSRQIIDDLRDKNTINRNCKFNLKFTNQFSRDQLVTLCTITDQSLISFKTRYGATTVDEIYWFATNNLRLSTSIIKQFNTCVAVSFCSEIKVSAI